MPRREIVRREARERLFFVSSSESRTTIQVNCELDLKSTANLTSSQVATSLQVKLGLHFNRHSDFTSSEREQPLWGCFWDAWRGTCLEVVIGGSVHGDRPCGRAERRGAGRLGFSCRDSRHRTETCRRSRRRIFTYGEMKIATSPFICRAAAISMPEELGNLQDEFQGFNTPSTLLSSFWIATRESRHLSTSRRLGNSSTMPER